MKIYCDEKDRSRVMDVVAPILRGIEKHLPVFGEPEVLSLSGQVRIELRQDGSYLGCDVVGDIDRVAREQKALAAIYAQQTAVGVLRISIYKDLPPS